MTKLLTNSDLRIYDMVLNPFLHKIFGFFISFKESLTEWDCLLILRMSVSYFLPVFYKLFFPFTYLLSLSLWVIFLYIFFLNLINFFAVVTHGFRFFKLQYGCPMTSFGPLLRGQPHSPDVNRCILHFQPEGHWEPRNDFHMFQPPVSSKWGFRFSDSVKNE